MLSLLHARSIELPVQTPPRYKELNAKLMALLREVDEVCAELQEQARIGESIPHDYLPSHKEIIEMLGHAEAKTRWRGLTGLSNRNWIGFSPDMSLAFPAHEPVAGEKKGWFWGRLRRPVSPPHESTMARSRRLAVAKSDAPIHSKPLGELVVRLALTDPNRHVQAKAMTTLGLDFPELRTPELVQAVARVALSTDDYFVQDAAYTAFYMLTRCYDHDIEFRAMTKSGFSPLRYNEDTFRSYLAHTITHKEV